MPRAAPKHMATTCSHVSGTAGECRMPYKLPLRQLGRPETGGGLA